MTTSGAVSVRAGTWTAADVVDSPIRRFAGRCGSGGGAVVLRSTRVTRVTDGPRPDAGWRVQAVTDDRAIAVGADYLVEATGRAATRQPPTISCPVMASSRR